MTAWSTSAGSRTATLDPDIIVPALAVTKANFRHGSFPGTVTRSCSAGELAEPSAQDSWPSPSIWPSSTLTGTRPYAVPPPTPNMIVLTKYHALYDFAAGLLSAVDTVWSRESNGKMGLLRTRKDRRLYRTPVYQFCIPIPRHIARSADQVR